MNELKWKQIGIVGVDAGLLMVGDPCYYFPAHGSTSESSEAYPEWGNVCAALESDDTLQLNYAKGHAGLGVVASTAHGDGTFPVHAMYAGDGRPLALCVPTDERATDWLNNAADRNDALDACHDALSEILECPTIGQAIEAAGLRQQALAAIEAAQATTQKTKV